MSITEDHIQKKPESKQAPKPKRKSKKAKDKNQLTLPFGMEDQVYGYPTDMTAKITGVTTRQLNTWVEREIVSASVLPGKGSGSTREFSYSDILEIRIVKSLRENIGIGLNKIAEIFSYVRLELQKEIGESILVLADERVVLACSDGDILSLISETKKSIKGQGILNLNILNLSMLKTEVDENIEKFWSEDPLESSFGDGDEESNEPPMSLVAQR